MRTRISSRIATSATSRRTANAATSTIRISGRTTRVRPGGRIRVVLPEILIVEVAAFAVRREVAEVAIREEILVRIRPGAVRGVDGGRNRVELAGQVRARLGHIPADRRFERRPAVPEHVIRGPQPRIDVFPRRNTVHLLEAPVADPGA